jgi:hypothetical protein
MQRTQVSFDTGLASRTAPSVELAHILRSHGEDYLQTRATSGELLVTTLFGGVGRRDWRIVWTGDITADERGR